MKLNRQELEHLVEFFSLGTQVPSRILRKVELGFWWVPDTYGPGPQRVSRKEWVERSQEPWRKSSREPEFHSDIFGTILSSRLLELFREGRIPYLLVRTNSWECYLNCNGEVFSETCEEDHASSSACCEGLRSRCSSSDLPPLAGE